MPPPRPRNVGNNSSLLVGRPNPTTPMSERQQMALLMQMTSTCAQDSPHNTRCLQSLKKNDEKKNDDQGGNSGCDTNDLYKSDDEFNSLKQSSRESIIAIDGKLESKTFNEIQSVLATNEDDPIESGSNLSSSLSSDHQSKKIHSDVDSSDGDFEETKRKKRKESESGKDLMKPNPNVRLPFKQEKLFKQTGGVLGNKCSSVVPKSNVSIEGKSPCLSPKQVNNKSNEPDILTEDIKITEQISGPKVPPLKIVIPQQNSSAECESSLRNGKAILVRNQAALPYVVSSNGNDESDKSISRCNSPTELLIKNSVTNIVLLTDEKNVKSSNEDKNLRVLRSSHRTCGSNTDISSSNSSPQLHSNSPSPAFTNAEIVEQSKTSSFVLANTSSPHSHQVYEQELLSSVPSPSTSTSSSKEQQSNVTELHPRKRKIRSKQDDSNNKTNINSSFVDLCSTSIDIHPHDYPFTNCIQMFLNIRRQIERKHQMLFPIKPRPPQGFQNYLMNRRSYILSDHNNCNISIAAPLNLPRKMRDIFFIQENDRIDLKLRHVVEKEKLGLSVEQEILRVHAKAARSLTYQSLPFSASTIFKDAEAYNMITPEQEEKDRNARSRFNGRLLLSWLQDVDDKWEKIKESMVLRHHNEAESLYAIQRMDWEVALKENELCDLKSQPVIEDNHVPLVHVSEEFDLIHT